MPILLLLLHFMNVVWMVYFINIFYMEDIRIVEIIVVVIAVPLAESQLYATVVAVADGVGEQVD